MDRLNVDEQGNTQQVLSGSVGPAWTRGDMEKPAGVMKVGTQTVSVYTEEQMNRLNVDEYGNSMPKEVLLLL